MAKGEWLQDKENSTKLKRVFINVNTGETFERETRTGRFLRYKSEIESKKGWRKGKEKGEKPKQGSLTQSEIAYREGYCRALREQTKGYYDHKNKDN